MLEPGTRQDADRGRGERHRGLSERGTAEDTRQCLTEKDEAQDADRQRQGAEHDPRDDHAAHPLS
jgi:hypothetical protein